MLDRLGVFVGGFDLAAAEEVCGAEPLAGEDVLDLLASLVEKSLVMLDERDDGARYRMLETIRDYAREKLDAARRRRGGRGAPLRPLLRDGQGGAQRAEGPEQADWIWRVEVELDNIRSAIALSLGGGVDPFIAVKFAVAMQGFWILRGYSTEGRKLVAGGAGAARDPGIAGRAGLGALRRRGAGRKPERPRRGAQDARDLPRAAPRAGQPGRHRGDAVDAVDGAPAGRRRRSRRPQARARRCRSSGASATASARRSACCTSARSACTRATTRRRASHLEQCLAIAREIKHQEVEGECELVLGEVAFETGDPAQACLRFKRSLTVCREAGDKRGEANALRWLARVDLQMGDLASARLRLSDAVARLPRLRDARGAARLPRRPRRARPGRGPGRNRGRTGGSGGAVTRAARPEACAAQRAALAGARRLPCGER